MIRVEDEKVVVYDLYKADEYVKQMELEMLRDEVKSWQDYLN